MMQKIPWSDFVFGGQKNKKAEVLPPAFFNSLLRFPFPLAKETKEKRM